MRRNVSGVGIGKFGDNARPRCAITNEGRARETTSDGPRLKTCEGKIPGRIGDYDEIAGAKSGRSPQVYSMATAALGA
jgi:hypothetical protein